MAAAVPVIGAIIASYVVSAAVREIGPKIGLSEDTSNLLGTIAGAYAGGMTYNAAAGSAAAGTTPPPDLSVPTTPAGHTAVAPPSQLPTTTPPPVSNIPGTPLAPSASPYASSRTAGGGMLSQAKPDLAVGNVPVNAAPPGSDTAGGLIKSNTVAGTGDAGTPTSWVEKLFSPDKTMDLVMAGMQGYGQAGIEQEKLEYPEEVAKKNAAGWAAAYPGQLSINPQYPTQGGG